MRALCVFLLTLGFLIPVRAAETVSGRVIKVLPLLLDQKGRCALSPSLFDRDAYQAKLHQNRKLVSTIRYDVLWSAEHVDHASLTLRVEVRGESTNDLPQLKTIEAKVKPGFFRQWTELKLKKATFNQFIAITAWRVTLWDKHRLLGKQQSFLW